jgi:hypothetical protein
VALESFNYLAVKAGELEAVLALVPAYGPTFATFKSEVKLGAAVKGHAIGGPAPSPNVAVAGQAQYQWRLGKRDLRAYMVTIPSPSGFSMVHKEAFNVRRC